MISFVSSVFPDPDRRQLNALYSWSIANVPVILVGKINKPENLNKRFPNIIYVPHVQTARDLNIDSDAPIVRSIIKEALPIIQTPMVGLINSDIIVKDNFMSVLIKAVAKNGYSMFLSCPRFDIVCEETVDTLKKLRRTFKKDRPHSDTSGDIFIGPKRKFEKMIDLMPNFIIGKYCWDNWIHTFFELYNDPPTKCFNCSRWLPVFHQDHGRRHINSDPGIMHNRALFKKTSIIRLNDWKPLTFTQQATR